VADPGRHGSGPVFGIELAEIEMTRRGKKGATDIRSTPNRSVQFSDFLIHRKRSKEGSDMLVLSRKLGEKIFISENICITIVDIDRGKVRLGIEAPREVPVFRQELLTNTEKPKSPDTPAVAK
jgi:carbon storage regulator